MEDGCFALHHNDEDLRIPTKVYKLVVCWALISVWITSFAHVKNVGRSVIDRLVKPDSHQQL